LKPAHPPSIQLGTHRLFQRALARHLGEDERAEFVRLAGNNFHLLLLRELLLKIGRAQRSANA
jgi:hypothetical protein